MRRGLVFWFTGLSGAGKTTTALLVEAMLRAAGHKALVLDGDALRAAISRDLGFDREAVRENNRRVAEYCARHRDQAEVIMVPIISPFAEDRAMVRSRLEPGFFEVWFSADLETVMARDVKGLYAKARAGEITNMIGYAKTHPYEKPDSACLEVRSGSGKPEESAERLFRFILERLNHHG